MTWDERPTPRFMAGVELAVLLLFLAWAFAWAVQ